MSNCCNQCFLQSIETSRQFHARLAAQSPEAAAMHDQFMKILDKEAERAKEMPPPPCPNCSVTGSG